jgi:hypothetical protein
MRSTKTRERSDSKCKTSPIYGRSLPCERAIEVVVGPIFLSILFSHCVLRYSLRPKPAVARLCGFLTVADAPAGTPDAAWGPSPDTRLRHVVL